MKKALFLLIIMAIVAPVSVWAAKPIPRVQPKTETSAPFELKGIKIGSSVSVLKEKYDLVCQEILSVRADVLCDTDSAGQYSDLGMFAETRATYIGYSYFGDKLGHAMVKLPTYGYPAIVEAFTAKYGKPSSIEKSDTHTKGGALYTNETVKWRRSGQSVESRKYYGDVDTMVIMVYQDSYYLEFARRSDEKAKENAKSL